MEMGMSRSGYCDDDYDNWSMIRWRGVVASASRGKRGQQFFKDLLAALEAMPIKRLVSSELETAEGEVCALGALGRARGINMAPIDPEDSEKVADTFGIADVLAREVVYMNDEYFWHISPEERYVKMCEWAQKNITTPSAA
jgi:hypothetical protein